MLYSDSYGRQWRKPVGIRRGPATVTGDVLPGKPDTPAVLFLRHRGVVTPEEVASA